MKRTLAIALAAAAVGLGGSLDLAAQSQPAPAGKNALADHGRYLVKIAGCNDCHTPGYMANAGKVDEKVWLTGDQLGWSGPWGTTYAVNLRLYMKDMTEARMGARRAEHEGAAADAVVHVRGDVGPRSPRHLPVREDARPGRRAGAGLPAARHRAERPGRAVPVGG